MNAERHQRISELFAEVYELPPAEQDAYLRVACGDDHQLLHEVESLLLRDRKENGLLAESALSPILERFESGASGVAYGGAEGCSPALPDAAIPGYRILKEIHRGGQGVVYQALQESTKRKVALKVMLEGPFAGAASKRRFEREIELVGSLDHPGIVPIFDSGVARGRFYFAMRYVRGTSLTQYVHEHALSVDDTLSLFAKVCDAVDHAHQRGVIHRDLKPSNILIDSNGEPHIVDFGLARIGGPDSERDKSLLISVTGQVMGTPAYMSPEQAAGRSDQIDMRSDVYALGVVLYELLTGRLPYDLSGSMAKDLTTIQTCEPRRFSTRRRRIKNEVETIVLKALSKDKQRRYATAGTFGQDVGHFLNDEPIEAKRDSAVYVLRKVLRRYRVPAAIAAAFVLLLVASSVVAWSLYVAANQERATAVYERGRANELRVIADANAEELRRKLYVFLIRRAFAAYDNGDLHQMRELLDRTDQDLRKWEWVFGDRLAQPTEVFRRQGTRPARIVTPNAAPRFIQDGKHILLAGFEGETHAGAIKICDADTGTVVGTWATHDDSLISMAVTPNTRRFAFSGVDHVIAVYDVGSEVPLWKRSLHDAWACIAFSPDGDRLVSASLDRTIKIIDSKNGEVLLTIGPLEYAPWSPAMSPDGKYVVTGWEEAGPSNATIWDANTGEMVRVLDGHNRTVTTVAYSPNGRQIVTGSADHTVRIWDTDSGHAVHVLRGHTLLVRSLAFSPDGTRIASGGDDQLLLLWDAKEGRILGRFAGHRSGIRGVSFNASGDRIASFCGNIQLRVWDAGSRPLARTLRGHVGRVCDLAFSPDGSRLASGGEDGEVKVWETSTGRLLRTMTQKASQWNQLTRVAWRAKANPALIAIANQQESFTLYDADTGRPVATPNAPAMMYSLGFSPDGSRLAYGGCHENVGRTFIWDLAANRIVRVLEGHTGRTTRVFWFLNGQRLATSNEDQSVRLWDTATGQCLRTLTGHEGYVMDVAVSSDGRRIASGSVDGSVRVWDYTTGECLGRLVSRDTFVSTVAFSTDDQRLFSGGSSGEISVWDPARHELVLTLRGHQAAVFCVAPSPDGRTLASASTDGTVKFWDHW